jgi:hypothetical protein
MNHPTVQRGNVSRLDALCFLPIDAVGVLLVVGSVVFQCYDDML